MNKSTWQSFAAGIIFATAILAGVYYYEDEVKKEEPITETEAKKILEAQGFSVTKATIEDKDIAEKSVESVPNKKEEPVISYTLHVKKRMNVAAIAKILEQEKIIENAAHFSDYMDAQQLTRNVQINTYRVTSEMSYRELSELLTK